MIHVAFKTSSEKVARAIQARWPKLVENIRGSVDSSMLALQQRIQRKMSGEVLKSHRGGAGLIGSVHKQPTQVNAGEIVGRVQAGGGLYWWLVVHEYGGQKTYEILPGAVTGKSDKRALAFFPTGSTGSGFKRTRLTSIRFASGKRRGELKPKKYSEFHQAGGVIVKRVEHPPLPRRSTLGASVNELRTEIISKIYQAAANAMRGR